MKHRILISLLFLASALSVALVSETRGVKGKNDPVNFSENIAPIIFSNCTTCHRPGEAAPFALLNYNDVKKRGKLIASITKSRIMPPWKADRSDYPFKSELRLSDAQIEMIQQWVAAGMPEGDPKKLPPVPNFIEGWQLGQPDMIVKMREGFSVPADGPDIYRDFAIPLNLTEDKWIRAIEFRPGARSVLHHSLFFYDTTGTARKLDEDDPGPGYTGGMAGLNRRALGRLNGAQIGRVLTSGGISSVFGSLGGWAVGAQARVLPEGLAWFLPKGADLIMSTHFHPSGKVEKEISSIGLYFAEKPPVKRFTSIQVPPLFGIFEGLEIPAGAKDYTIEGSFVLPVDVKAFGVAAHAHYLGKQMKMTAILPGGQTKTLLSISDWDFSWQGQYQFKDYVALPKGTRLNVKISYDNSAENPHNPSNPPKQVFWGENSTDEMGTISLVVVAADEAELPQLQQAWWGYMRDAFLKNPEALIKLRERAAGNGQ